VEDHVQFHSSYEALGCASHHHVISELLFVADCHALTALLSNRGKIGFLG